jgi:hypothetical protein
MGSNKFTESSVMLLAGALLPGCGDVVWLALWMRRLGVAQRVVVGGVPRSGEKSCGCIVMASVLWELRTSPPCCRARVWLCWTSLTDNIACAYLGNYIATMTSDQTLRRGFEIRGVVKPLVFLCRHLALLALCHLFSRQATQATRKSDILYTYSMVDFGLALSL